MRDVWRGAKQVKLRSEKYLPKPSGFKAMEDGGRAAYHAYRMRAMVPNLLAPTVRGMAGLIHRTEAQIEMPDAMQPLWEKATKDGLTLEAFHQTITRELLITGRFGILSDAPANPVRGGDDTPFMVGYEAEAIPNWSKEKDFYVLDECDIRRTGFEWQDHKKYRVLELKGGKYVVTVYDEGKEEELPTNARGGKEITEIPFVVVGATGIKVMPDEIPLQGVSEHTLAIYRLDADYRYQLYMSGQETLFITGITEVPKIVGAGVIIPLPGGEDGGKAEYVGPNGVGIEAHRQAILDEKDAAASAASRILEDSHTAPAESGDAKRVRFAAQTATLTSISQASAAALEKALKNCAIIMGQDPEKVVVKPNLKFVDSILTPQDALALVNSWQQGAFSYETLYDNLQRGEIASAERTADEERVLIENELPPVPPGPAPGPNPGPGPAPGPVPVPVGRGRGVRGAPTNAELAAWRAGKAPGRQRPQPKRPRPGQKVA
jgi:hypothetical protein